MKHLYIIIITVLVTQSLPVFSWMIVSSNFEACNKIVSPYHVSSCADDNFPKSQYIARILDFNIINYLKVKFNSEEK